MRNFVMTAESVTAGHPDKLCDQISDAVVDAWLASGDRDGVVAECAIASGVVFLSIRSGAPAPVDPAEVARRVIAESGYGEDFAAAAASVMVEMSDRPRDLARSGVAHHMVTAFGYACDRNPARMPLPSLVSHRLSRALDLARTEARLPWLSPDGQAQVAVRFADRRPEALAAIALTVALHEEVGPENLRAALLREVVDPALDGVLPARDAQTRLVVQARTGPAGPAGHSGLTGRKSADDAYGSFIRRSGSALSGKDPARIDRIANYAARHAARAVVEAGLARECEVQLSYIPGDAGPVTVEVDCMGAGADAAALSAKLAEAADFRVGAIAERFGLWDLPTARGGRFYRDLASYGHMGRDDLDAPWEDTSDLAAALSAG